MVVPAIVTAGCPRDASIGTTDIEIPSMTEAGISTGMRIGIDHSTKCIQGDGPDRAHRSRPPRLAQDELVRVGPNDRTKNGQA